MLRLGPAKAYATSAFEMAKRKTRRRAWLHMSEFDIAQFANFRPPRYLCPRCASIWREFEEGYWPDGWEYDYHAEPEAWICGVCHLRFEATRDYPEVDAYLRRWRCGLESEDLTTHLKVLASAGAELSVAGDRYGKPRRSLRNLVSALNEARHFIHLVSWSVSWEFIGLLALLSHRISVRGVISQCDEGTYQRVKAARDYGGRDFEVVPLPERESADSPHQKLIIIDGFLAISGSPNLTGQAWRKLDNFNEQIALHTRPEEVWELNNRFFSPVWSRLHPVENDVAPMRRHGNSWAESLLAPRRYS
jgi:hypothetical protein